MAATAEAQNETKATGIKKVWTETVDQVQTRFKGVEAKIKSSVDTFQSRFKVAGEDGKKRIETLRGQLKIDELLARFKSVDSARELVDEGVKLTGEALDGLGVAKLADLDALKANVDQLIAKLETVRKRAAESVSKRDFKKLVERVTKLEKSDAA